MDNDFEEPQGEVATDCPALKGPDPVFNPSDTRETIITLSHNNLIQGSAYIPYEEPTAEAFDLDTCDTSFVENSRQYFDPNVQEQLERLQELLHLTQK